MNNIFKHDFESYEAHVKHVDSLLEEVREHLLTEDESASKSKSVVVLVLKDTGTKKVMDDGQIYRAYISNFDSRVNLRHSKAILDNVYLSLKQAHKQVQKNRDMNDLINEAYNLINSRDDDAS